MVPNRATHHIFTDQDEDEQYNFKLKIILLVSKMTFQNVKLKSIAFPVSTLWDFEVKQKT